MFVGDLCLILPVISTRSTSANELTTACMKHSTLSGIREKKITLSTNMRVHLLRDDFAQIFSKQLLDMGNDELPTLIFQPQEISFPQNFCQLQPSIKHLEKQVFPNIIIIDFRNYDSFCERVILAPKNDDVNRINNKIQLKILVAVTEYKFIDTAIEHDRSSRIRQFITAIMWNLTTQTDVQKFVRQYIQLLRNLNTSKLCNGTRQSVKKLNGIQVENLQRICSENVYVTERERERDT